MSRSNQLIVAMVAVVVLAGAFWILALSPKREEAASLKEEVNEAKTALAQHQQEVAQALEARKDFSANYQEMVVLGKAVPREDQTASLLVQLDAIANAADVRFQEIQLSGEGGGEAAAAEATATGGTEPAPPTEVAASLLPLGATVGSAGLGVMPYTLKFTGDFSHIAHFIKGLDAFVKSTNAGVKVDGRLITVNGFVLGPASGASFPQLEATFSITTYTTPPGAAAPVEATPTETLETATPTATITGATP
jgi:Tfp pilus assembly protein PilO